MVGSLAYVIDEKDKKVYRFDVFTGAALGISKALKSNTGGKIDPLLGLAIDGDDMWVSTNKAKLFRYSLAAAFSGAGNLNALQVINASGGNGKGDGLAIDATYLYVVDSGTKRVYRYNRSGAGTASASKVLKTTSGGNLGTPKGVALDGTTVYVCDNGTDRIYQYTLTSLGFGTTGNVNAAAQWSLSGSNGESTGLDVIPSPTPTATFTATHTPTNTFTPTNTPTNTNTPFPGEVYLFPDPSVITVPGAPGGTVDVNLMVHQMNNLHHYAVSVSFDNTVVRVEDVADGPFLDGAVVQGGSLPNTSGVLNLTEFASANTSGSGVLATITLRSVTTTGGISPLTLGAATNIFQNAANEDIFHEFDHGTVIVASPTPTNTPTNTPSSTPTNTPTNTRPYVADVSANKTPAQALTVTGANAGLYVPAIEIGASVVVSVSPGPAPVPLEFTVAEPVPLGLIGSAPPYTAAYCDVDSVTRVKNAFEVIVNTNDVDDVVSFSAPVTLRAYLRGTTGVDPLDLGASVPFLGPSSNYAADYKLVRLDPDDGTIEVLANQQYLGTTTHPGDGATLHEFSATITGVQSIYGLIKPMGVASTETPTETPTGTPTSTSTNTPTSTPTSTPTNTPTSTPTDTPTPNNVPDWSSY